MENTDEIQVATDIEQDEKQGEANAYPSRGLVNDAAYLRRSAMETDRTTRIQGWWTIPPQAESERGRLESLNSTWTRIGTYTTETGL